MKLTALIFTALLVALSLRADANIGRASAHAERGAGIVMDEACVASPINGVSDQWKTAMTWWRSLVGLVVRVIREAIAMVLYAVSGDANLEHDADRGLS